ncbi:hypothetical protein BO78DRAFT_183846 [Aspergillus sclerotiicarbonarius CBS 121057]|uniref:Uncharacterized protein n=1 Tax=Aspergillus sclerotiicarbonarius (strain CBS 121057 / IBT 28362) TaxID=1448318 RepID=A0A319FMP3_ASPSB|nr:hypothetical protein BO78DRAFT_183846 [Aspergillus sclerotiicarbonarius CBS 121057]
MSWRWMTRGAASSRPSWRPSRDPRYLPGELGGGRPPQSRRTSDELQDHSLSANRAVSNGALEHAACRPLDLDSLPGGSGDAHSPPLEGRSPGAFKYYYGQLVVSGGDPFASTRLCPSSLFWKRLAWACRAFLVSG